eukprot:GHVS01098691.1.p1 GENE.GHVS01098691.1~~GHVS01098691.1.p1  ORF type:complete len:194 (+),score=58.65 GHVS01098691.1:278-859(+)
MSRLSVFLLSLFVPYFFSVCLCSFSSPSPHIWEDDPEVPEEGSQQEPDVPEDDASYSNILLKAATAAAAAVAALAPVLVTPLVNAVGFTASGIAAGSTAAGMMSSAALASGGGVAAGGTVATLQSIGVVGLTVGPAVALAAGGAILGAAVLGGAVYTSLKINRWFRGKTEENTTSSGSSSGITKYEYQYNKKA